MANKIDIFNLGDTSMTSGIKGQKILVYGSNSVGKSLQASKMPKPLMLLTEAGGNACNCAKVNIRSWNDFINVVQQLTSNYEKASKQFQTIIIDTSDALISLAESFVCRKYGCSTVGEVQGVTDSINGYLYARGLFKQQIDLLTSFDYTVMFNSHEVYDEKYIDALTGNVVTKIIPHGSDKPKSSHRYLRDLCDFTFFIEPQGLDENGNVIMSKALCKETKNVFARSRYSGVQTFIEPYTAENLIKAIENGIKRTADDEGMKLVSKRKVDEQMTKEDWFALIEPYIKKCFKTAPDFVKKILSENLGEGKKLTSATDEQINKLENIYNDLVDYCCINGIVIN